MNTMTYTQTVRQKAKYEKLIDLKSKICVYCPREDNNGEMYFCSHSGDIYKFKDDGQFESSIASIGQPNSNFTDYY